MTGEHHTCAGLRATSLPGLTSRKRTVPWAKVLRLPPSPEMNPPRNDIAGDFRYRFRRRRRDPRRSFRCHLRGHVQRCAGGRENRRERSPGRGFRSCGRSLRRGYQPGRAVREQVQPGDHHKPPLVLQSPSSGYDRKGIGVRHSINSF